MKKVKRNPSVIIIGAGMTGILMTIKLREVGITNITILEKKGNIGGTWRENTYPGVACDVPAHLYTYEFERNPDWSHRFASGDEIQQYFEKVGRKYGITEKVRFNEAVVGARYHKGRWAVQTSKKDTLVADFLISATGILHHPFKPDFSGQKNFKGSVFHTAQWDHSVDLKGKRVGVIGTGSTAAQVISSLADVAGNLTVFQRTPQWVFNLPNRKFSESEKKKCRSNPFRIPLVNWGYRTLIELVFFKAVTGNRVSQGVLSWLTKRNLKKSVEDPLLRQKLTPDYKVGCKRLVISGTFYDAIQKDNVDLATEAITRFVDNGIETDDGKIHELDVIVLATGFDPAAYMRPMNLVGKSGQDIDRHWQNKVQAYRSMFIPDYPNFFLMLGPNSPIGNFSVIKISEVQTDYVIKMIDKWREGQFDEVMVTPEVLQRFNAYLKEGMKNTVWVSGGCSSWYLDADGDPLTWPYSWKQWNEQMQEPDMADFEIASYGQQDHC